MRRYSIDPGPIAPSGQWRFRRGPDDDPPDSDDGAYSYVSEFEATLGAPGDEKEDRFRDERDPDAIAPLLLAAARAAGRMPVLRSMFFVLNAVGGSSGWLEVDYTVKRSRASAGVGSAGLGGEAVTATLLVDGHPVFHPDMELTQAWREVAREHVGAESKLEVIIKDGMDW